MNIEEMQSHNVLFDAMTLAEKAGKSLNRYG